MLNEERISVFHCDCGVGLRSAHGSVIKGKCLGLRSVDFAGAVDGGLMYL